MKRRFLALAGGAAVLAFVTPSAAGGLLHSPPEPQWAGFYAGGQLGGAWRDASWDYKNSNWFNTLGPEVVISNFGIDAGGFLGGGQTGFNFQSGAWIFGVEGSVAGTDLGSRIRSPFFPEADSYRADVGLLATVTGRVGYARGRWLAYGKGGWAGADVELDLFDQVTPVRAKSSTWADGYTLGGGAEYAVRNGFSFGVDYLSTSIPIALQCVAPPAPLVSAVEFPSWTAASKSNP
jgi:outer membrane immunogenic protein